MINGFAAEQILSNLITTSKKIKGFKLPSSEELIKIASQSELGRKRLNAAHPHLLKEFGVDYRHTEMNQLSQIIDWKLVPNTLILDYIFGIDAVVNVLGFVIAIDVTVNLNAIEEKQHKLSLLKPLWQQVGIDKACICYVNNPSPINLWHSLKTVTKQNQVLVISV
jgi:hypothetical protein